MLALGASSRLRVAQYVPFLRKAGLDIALRPFLDNAYLAALYAGQSRRGAALAAYGRAFSLLSEIERKRRRIG
ncbi:hypothetical protein SAMN02746095_01800 [Acidocella aminolytica 101 = DSM 11237]|jgi:hypothetical protein|uniref:Uncharacterized protein n=2 Tax=Acidocella TaxID=50709 RepID=A0A0D6PDI2_9PROT|nr:hypothetical protein [Acidocella aminolytica]GAN78929.1 hypothetical protein Aam_011_050 [Acidocella aminolytica 101 = DSM 11237]GBQ42211.1 hypothetical protein AA11237_2899 [Acidocella aminolytica 101 = DSM 11237]SHE99535.1 hypothetical protein SAMN02746095_01800 [Acidocella aminolytica 101 = DSM 11237]